MINANKQIKGARVAIFGVTFKEDCPDVRNTKVVDIIRELEEYGIEVKVVDPVADANSLRKEYNLNLCRQEEVEGMDAVIFAVAHEEFKSIKLKDVQAMLSKTNNRYMVNEVAATASSDMDSTSDNEDCVLIDVKGIFDLKEAEKMGFLYWRL